MILIGQFDSPFVRRVGIALRLYDLPFEHRPWSVWKDADALGAVNPLRRVPTLVLDDGIALLDSSSILDALDERMPEEKRLLPARGPERQRLLRTVVLATGLADKAVSLFYEVFLHEYPSPKWVDRCARQIEAVHDVLDAEKARLTSPSWGGANLSHADIAVACALRFTQDALAGRFDLARWPALKAHSARCEALPVFQEISQPFSV